MWKCSIKRDTFWPHFPRAACVPHWQTSSHWYIIVCSWCSRAFGMTCVVQQKPNSLVSKQRRGEKKYNGACAKSHLLFQPKALCLLFTRLALTARECGWRIAHSSLCAPTKSSISPGKQCRRSSGLFNFHKNSSCARVASHRISQTGSPHENSCCCLVHSSHLYEKWNMKQAFLAGRNLCVSRRRRNRGAAGFFRASFRKTKNVSHQRYANARNLPKHTADTI